MAWQTVTQWPRLQRVRQTFPGREIDDLPAAVAAACTQIGLSAQLRRGDRVAITAGSRGVRDMTAVIRATVAQVKALGAEPFVFPCMGSHGGATAEGQAAVLESYGVTTEGVGAPVISQPEVVSLGQTTSGIPLWADRLAAEAEHLIVINRVKPHTDFTGLLESGPTKMLAIGLGKWFSASDCHRRFVDRGYEAVIREVGDALWERLPVAGAIGLVENGHDRTVRIAGIRRSAHESDEAALLAYSKEVFGYLPTDHLDILIIDAIGKNISGAGMDPNVTGTDCARVHTPPDLPRIQRILVRSLTPESHGNAAGIGMADFALRRCVEAIDWAATATNVVVAAAPESGRCPLVCATDREMLEAACLTTGSAPPEQLRIARIRSTLEVDDLLVSEPLLAELAAHPRCQLVGPLEPLVFDAAGFLPEIPPLPPLASEGSDAGG